MINSVDQLGNHISLQEHARRIVSLVPSQTELLYDLGLDEEVLGITKFCIHPDEWFRTKQRVGGTKNFNIETIRSLKPDLIIANKEENDPIQINNLQKEFPVYISDIKSFHDALSMIIEVSRITGRESEGENIIDEIQHSFSSQKSQLPELRTAYLIWKNPMMTIGGDTFISDMMKQAGFINVFESHSRYPEISLDDISKKNPEVLLLSSEPFPFKDKHVDEFRELLPEMMVHIADGEMFSWYGSRMRFAPAYFLKLRELISSPL